VLLGAAGHAKVIIEIFQEAQDWEVVGCLSADAPGGSVKGIPILGDDSELEAVLKRGVTHAFAAIGDNRIRSRVCDRLQQAGFRLINAVSHRAIVSPSVRMASGIAIMPGAVINAESDIGAGAIVNTGATIDHDCCVGSFSHIGPGSNLAGGVRVGTGAFLGVGSRVIPNIEIGEWSILGAGSVAIADIPPRVTAVGIPAKVIQLDYKK
jgi:UDP-perosamine 4-acetyltransferase